jgi:hypothetical protein
MIHFFIAETEGLFKQIERYVFPCLLLVEKINLFPSSSQATTILFAFVFIDILSEADNQIFYRTDLFYIIYLSFSKFSIILALFNIQITQVVEQYLIYFTTIV